MIFLDAAGACPPPPNVLDEVIGHLRREGEVGGYRAAAEREADLERAYPVFAELLGCEPDEVAFTDSATRSWLTLVDSIPLEAGDRVLVSEAEYGANAVALLRLAELSGAGVELVPSDESGQLDVAALRNRLDERVKLVSLVHVPTNGGLVNPVREVTEAAHEAGALVLLDACQSVGQLPVHVAELGVDLLSGTGRKWLRGPRGTGFLVARRAAADRLRPRLFDHSGADWSGLWEYRLRGDARVHELWEFGVAERLGLVKAAEHALELGLEQIAAQIAERSARLRTGLAAIPGVAVHDLGERPSGLVTFTVDGLEAARVKELLWDKDIVVSVTAEGSTRFDMGRRGLSSMVRASPHYFVTPAQLDEFLTVVTGLR